MEWMYLINENDIRYLQDLYHNFEDSILVRFSFESGNYIDDELVGYEYDKNDLRLFFQRMDTNPFAIEIVFEGVKRLNYFAPVLSEMTYSSEIYYAKIAKNDKYVYWTNWKEFNPYNEEHLSYNDFILVEACKAKWRIIS